MPELRKDPIVDRWVIIASNRAQRPNAFVTSRAWEGAEPCPFCEGHEKETPGETFAFRRPQSVPDGPGWRVRVVPNKFPSLAGLGGEIARHCEGLCESIEAAGAHEVIIESPRHIESVSEMTPEAVAEVFLAYRQRLLHWKQDPRLRYAVVFKNVGAAAGASLQHTHSQLMALPIVPTSVREEIAGAAEFFRLRGRCVYCHLIDEELTAGRRVVLQAPRLVAFAPFASRFPFETWILPRTHVSHFEDAADDLLEDLAAMVRSVVARIETASARPAYNYFLHTSPFDTGDLGHYHWHIEVIPALTQAAGFEWGSGCFVNPVPPEDAAAFLRGANV
ncbi:MAG: galactose-1-phosphate uridylyltransferase [Thermoguttaceae bacterium]|jgi:UDPglucose--hexose-1-phosphate uridylyltransferase